MVQWTLHSCQNKRIFSWQKTKLWSIWHNDGSRRGGGSGYFSSVLLTCVQPRIGTENVNESVILTRTGTWSGTGSASVALPPRCNGRSTLGWRFLAEMQIWIVIEISLWTLSEVSACTWRHTTRQMAVKDNTCRPFKHFCDYLNFWTLNRTLSVFVQ